MLPRPSLSYIATSPDLVCPTKFDKVPNRSSVCIGKQFPLISQLVMAKLSVTKEEVCMVGDRIYTDVKLGLAETITADLVPSGEISCKILEASYDKFLHILQDAGEILLAPKARN